MKCKAAEVLHDKREQACGAEYGLIFLEFIDCMMSDQIMDQHKWRRKRLQWFYDRERHFLSDYIARYVADKGHVKDQHRGYRPMTEGELLSEGIETTQERVDKELASFGFTYDPAVLVPSGWKAGWKRREQSKAAVRMAWYAQNGGRAARLYLTSQIKMLHDERGFGAERAGKLFDPVAAEIRWFLEKFFAGTDAADLEIKKKIDAVHKKLEGFGLEMVQVPASDAVSVREKETKTAVPPPGLEHLTWDALKDTNTFDITRKVY